MELDLTGDPDAVHDPLDELTRLTGELALVVMRSGRRHLRRGRVRRSTSSFEISHGLRNPIRFVKRAKGVRKVALPAEVEIDQATAEQRNGLLWISLPLKQ